MALSENIISRAIIESYSAKLLSHLEVDAALVGGGPSALTAARILAQRGKKVAVFERNLAPGGGVWGGGMLFNNVVVQDDVLDILDEIGIAAKGAIVELDGAILAADAAATTSLREGAELNVFRIVAGG